MVSRPAAEPRYSERPGRRSSTAKPAGGGPGDRPGGRGPGNRPGGGGGPGGNRPGGGGGPGNRPGAAAVRATGLVVVVQAVDRAAVPGIGPAAVAPGGPGAVAARVAIAAGAARAGQVVARVVAGIRRCPCGVARAAKVPNATRRDGRSPNRFNRARLPQDRRLPPKPAPAQQPEPDATQDRRLRFRLGLGRQ